MMDAATRLILVRHGETAWNVERRLQGHRDVELNSTGHKQAQCVAEALQLEQVHAVYSSDLKRAHDTAQRVVDAHSSFTDDIVREPALRERRLGVLEGLTRTECAARHPEVISNLGQPDYVFEGGETLTEFADRVVNKLEDIASRHTGQTVLVVTHGGVLNVALTHVLQLPYGQPRRFSISNASINEMTWQPSQGWHLHVWNNVVHLKDAEPLPHHPVLRPTQTQGN